MTVELIGLGFIISNHSLSGVGVNASLGLQLGFLDVSLIGPCSNRASVGSVNSGCVLSMIQS